ncbi:MAG: tetratricopeptide repeat protein, partial [Candidatus Eiseniibacteriota bacterium]
MMLVACTLVLVAATSALPSGPPQAPGSRYPSEEALLRYARGRLLEEQGRRDLAIGEYSRALLLDGAGSLARRMSEASAISGEPSRSLEFADRALAIDATDARAHWLRGAALLNLGRGVEALPPLEMAATLDSERVEYARTLGRAAESVDRLDLAMRGFRRAVWLEPEDAESWFQIAAGEARLGRFGAADTALARSMALNSLRPGAAFLQGLIHESLGRTDQAMDLYRQHLTAHPLDAATRRRAVNLLAREKRFEEAWREARLMAEALPDDRESSEIEADLAFSAGRGGDGDRALQRMHQRWPRDPEVLAATVAVLARHGRGNRAVAEAE